MKLSTAQTNLVGQKLGLDVIDQKSEAQPHFEEAFGDHSFFVNSQGVFIIEDQPDEATVDGSIGSEQGRLYAVATWAEDKEDQLLMLAEPANVNVTIDLRTGDVYGAQ